MSGETDQVLADVARKRLRQIEFHGWTREHDDAHVHGEVAIAAIPSVQAASPASLGLSREDLEVFWPWDSEFKPDTDRRENLVNAAALIVAEIERLDRLKARGGT